MQDFLEKIERHIRTETGDLQTIHFPHNHTAEVFETNVEEPVFYVLGLIDTLIARANMAPPWTKVLTAKEIETKFEVFKDSLSE